MMNKHAPEGTMYDMSEKPIEGTLAHGTHGWLENDENQEYIYCKDEGWMLRADFEKKHSTGYALK